MEILIKAAQLILSLSILVVLHEMGHFLPAKWFKTRVEKFYLFFNPGFSLFKKKIGETEYGIGWLPLGGYVKISGMVDESMDTEALKQEPKPYEFRSKPAWQRLIIMVGGVTVNLILGFLIYIMIMFVWGENYINNSDVTYGVHIDDKIASFGFEEGDQIYSLNGEDILEYNSIRRYIFSNKVSEVGVVRNGEKSIVKLPADFGQVLIDSNVRDPFGMRFPCVISLLEADKPAIKAGLQIGDSIVAVNGVRAIYFGDVAREITREKNSEIELTLFRNGQEMAVSLTTNESGRIGFGANSPTDRSDFNFQHKSYSFLEAIPAGFNEASEVLQGYVLGLRFLFSKSGATQVGSFLTIGSIFDAGWDWRIFWSNTAFLSLILAFMNLLPIPALDGGHVVFLLYEIVAGRPAPQKFLERAQMVGIVLLLSLMVYAMGNDIYRAIFGGF